MIVPLHDLPNQNSSPLGSQAPKDGVKVRLPRIISIGRDTSLLSTNAAILRGAGFTVRSAAPKQASELVIVNFYRIAVFDQSLSDGEVAELAICARAVNPRTKLLLIGGSKPRPPFIQVLFDVTVAPSELPVALRRFRESIAVEILAQPPVLPRKNTVATGD